MVAEKDVDNEDSEWDPKDEDGDGYSLEADLVDKRNTVLLVYFFVVKFLLHFAVGHFLDVLVLSFSTRYARTVLGALPQCIYVQDGAEDNFKCFPHHVECDGSRFDTR